MNLDVNEHKIAGSKAWSRATFISNAIAVSLATIFYNNSDYSTREVHMLSDVFEIAMMQAKHSSSRRPTEEDIIVMADAFASKNIVGGIL